MAGDNVLAFSPATAPPRGRISKPERIDRLHRFRAAGLKPEQLARVLRDTERGEMERFADLAEYILRTDPHVRSVSDTVIRSIVASELRITAAKVKPEYRRLAEEQAHFIRESFSLAPMLGETLAHLLHGYMLGASVAEHCWRRFDNAWYSTSQKKVFARDIEWNEDWQVKIRTFAERKAARGKWICTADEPARWIVHQPGAIGTTPNLAGALQAVVWPWLFKRWAQIYQQTGLERFANPLLVGKAGENATDESREAFHDGLEGLLATSAAVLEQDQEVEIVQASGSPTDSWGEAIDRYNAEITKAMLGSTLNVEIGEPGGNRAAAESQASVTILPRLQSIATSLGMTVRAHWIEPALFFNAAKFGSHKIPPPEVGFILKQEEGPRVTPELIAAGVITVNEFREAQGFDPLDDAQGRRIVRPIMKSPLADGVARPARPEPEPTPQAPDETQQAEDPNAKDPTAALNGAQVTALLDIIERVASGQLPRDTGISVIVAAFPITRPEAEQIMGTVGTPSFEPDPEGEAPELLE
ncbi:MAG: DUF935 family protein [Myxococcota bacterium]